MAAKQIPEKAPPILPEAYKKRVIFLDAKKDNICEQKQDGKVYAVTGDQFHKCIEK